MSRIEMKTPLVEMDGDEMTRVIWEMIKDKLILPFVDLKTEYYDLGLKNRSDTGDTVTFESAEATRRLGVAVKCATITPNKQRIEEFDWLKKLLPSPNATIRGVLDGTVFRAPITVGNIRPIVSTWEKPITVARHAYGDIYKAVEILGDEPGVATLRFTGESGEIQEHEVAKIEGGAVFMGMHNTVQSITSFARACFEYALATNQDLWFGAKDTISKTYDGLFRDIFEAEYAGYSSRFSDQGIEYFYTLIDDAVARIMRSKGGMIWACKNYDGDVMSDMVSTAFGSLAMMTSVLVSPEGVFEYEAAHGTVTQHYYRYLKGEETSTNPVATIFAWSGALRKRGELDGISDLCGFADRLDSATLGLIEEGYVTKDLVNLVEGEATQQSTVEFLDKIAVRL